MVYFWIALTVILVIVEALTVQLVTIWFAAGSLAAVIAAFAGADTMWQFIIFAAVSLIALLVSRPYVKKVIQKKAVPTNADRCIGKQAVVIQTISNRDASGQVKVEGAVWSARSGDDSVIEEGETVLIKKIEGVKVVVEKIKTEITQ